MKLSFLAPVATLLGQSQGAACPYELLRRSGLLGADDAAKFDAVKRDSSEADRLFREHRNREAEALYEVQTKRLDSRQLLPLPFGGGLLGGVLQPLTGALSGIDIPTPQPQGLALIPGDDPKHQFEAPGPTDVRGICPTLNTLANVSMREIRELLPSSSLQTC